MQTKDLRDILETFTALIKEDKIRPITGLCELYAKDGMFHIGCSDKRTTVVANIADDSIIDNTVISLSALYKLVKLTTKDTITLTRKETYLELKGNGKYKIPIQLDELGREINLPLEMPEEETLLGSYNDWGKALTRNQIGIFKDKGHLEFTLYYMGDDGLITTDSIILACTKNINLPKGNLQSYMVSQLATIKEDMNIYKCDSGYIISNATYKIYMVDHIDYSFPIEMIKEFIQGAKFSAPISLVKKEFVDAVQRQDIFKSVIETPTIILDVKENKLILKNKAETSEEVLTTVSGIEPVSVILDTKLILNILKNMNKDIKLYFSERFIKLEDEDGFYFLAIKI